MLTTSRREVTIDNKYDNVLTKANAYGTDAESNVLLADAVREEVNEVSATEIALKFFGGKEYKEQEELSGLTYDEPNPDLKPSSRTMETGKESPKIGLISDSLKAKGAVGAIAKTRVRIVVAAYLAVVLALAILVAFSAFSASGAYASVQELFNEQNMQQETIDALVEELNNVDPAAILDLASQMGYTLAGPQDSMTYETPKMRAAQHFNVESNWFDKLCEVISNIFGE